jgi:hypothetical protein
MLIVGYRILSDSVYYSKKPNYVLSFLKNTKAYGWLPILFNTYGLFYKSFSQFKSCNKIVCASTHTPPYFLSSINLKKYEYPCGVVVMKALSFIRFNYFI